MWRSYLYPLARQGSVYLSHDWDISTININIHHQRILLNVCCDSSEIEGVNVRIKQIQKLKEAGQANNTAHS
jgi:hypothetical protein